MSSEDFIDWHTEALAVIEDVKSHVKAIAISEKLITGKKMSFVVWWWKLSWFIIFLVQDVGIYINLKTLEGQELTCFLDSSGFKIVGFNFDSCDSDDSEEVFETIYALIQSHSPGYTKSFGNALVDKLSKLSWTNVSLFLFEYLRDFYINNRRIKIDCAFDSSSASSSTIGTSCFTWST